MKIAILLSLFSVFTVNAQFSFTDDFESYTVGDYIAAADTLWGWPVQVLKTFKLHKMPLVAQLIY